MRSSRREACAEIAFYVTARSYEGILDLHGGPEAKRGISEAFRTFDLAAMASCVTDEMIDAIAVTGTPSECRERFQQWEGLIDTPFFYVPSIGASPERVALNDRRILETFRDGALPVVRQLGCRGTRLERRDGGCESARLGE